DGSEREVHEAAEIIRDATGRPTRMIGTVQDVTEQRRAEKERERLLRQVEAEQRWLKTVIETSPVGILLIEGANGERITANAWAERLFGWPLQPDAGAAQLAGHVCRRDGTPLNVEELASSRALRGEVVVGDEQLLPQPGGRSIPTLVN